MNLKSQIVAIAQSMGFQRTVIASMAPMEKERVRYLDWVEKGYAAEMGYLKRDPISRTTPATLVKESRSAIVLSVSYYTEVPPAPSYPYGRVARYAVGEDYHNVIPRKLKLLAARLEEILGRPVLAKPYTDDVNLYEQGYAERHGLGFSGKHSLIIGPKLQGSYNFVAELFTDLELDADEPYVGTCGQCFRCGTACPTNAILAGANVDSRLCISYLTIENKGEIPVDLRSKLGTWAFGCDICQEVCPYNQRPEPTPWQEFQPEQGTGHHLNLLDVLKLKTSKEFLQLFGNTPLTRPKLKGMQRNALVVLGNWLGDQSEEAAKFDKERIVSDVEMFANATSEAMLREHACWALAQAPNSMARRQLERLAATEPDESVSARISGYLE